MKRQILFAFEPVTPESRIMKHDYKTPREADPKLLWALLRTKYKDGDELVDSESMIWDVWKKDDGYVLYCGENKEVVEVPRPKMSN